MKTLPPELVEIIRVLTNPENQPHQFVGKEFDLQTALLKSAYSKIHQVNKLDVSFRQAENGYILSANTSPPMRYIFRSAEELVQFIATDLLELPH